MSLDPDLGGMLLQDREYGVQLLDPIYRDQAQWYDHPIKLWAGPFTGEILSISHTGVEVLDDFLIELETLYRTLTGKASLGEHFYHNFIVELEGDGSGKITCKVDCTDSAYNARLSFTIALDQSYLPPAIVVLKRFVRDGYALRQPGFLPD